MHTSSLCKVSGRRHPMALAGHVIFSVTVLTGSAIAIAAPSRADATTQLQSEIDSARSDSGCPPLHVDPILTSVSQRIARETDDYVKHKANFLPTTNEIDLVPHGLGGLLRVMREMGSNTNKAKLLAGYGDEKTGGPGDNLAKAIKGAVLQGLGFEALPDCGYTRYGVSAIDDVDTSQGWPSTPPRTFAVTVVVLAGPE